jgi:propanol-preferring alcohol dehydrogenase
MDQPGEMRAMVLNRPGEELKPERVAVPEPGKRQVLIRVRACGVCHTDLHIVDKELTAPKLPLIPGHEIIGTIVKTGAEVDRFEGGERVGVPWVGFTCGECRYCLSGNENLCERAGFTGYTIDGGFAEYTVADQDYVFPVPASYSDLEAAPLMCAGLIGNRCLKLAGDPIGHLGIYGFGAAAHIVAQIARHKGIHVYAFTRPGDAPAQEFARQLGAAWAGPSDLPPPEELDAAIIFAPVGALVPTALKAVVKGGRVVCGGIHMSDIPAFPYSLLWGERVVRSVANLTRQDAIDLLEVAPRVPVRTEVERFPLEGANEALARMRRGELRGAAVLQIAEED